LPIRTKNTKLPKKKTKVIGVPKKKGRKPKPNKQKKMYILKCKFCDIEFLNPAHRITCSNKCKHALSGIRTSKWLKANRSHIKGRKEPSYMESSFQQWLLAAGIPNSLNGFLTEIHFVNINTGKNGWIDFLFPRQRLIIELDGNQHKKRFGLDAIRDIYLNNKGWKVIRITHSEYKKGTRIAEIKKELNIL
jgi:very-short-patch-repair endonuclease